MPTLFNEVNDPNLPDETAIHGISRGASSIALFGQGTAVGVRGDGSTWHGVAGISTSTTGGAGVSGSGDPGPGIIGTSTQWIGVYGETQGEGGTGACGILGDGKDRAIGVKGVATAEFMAGVAGYHLSGTGPAVYGNGITAGHFEGNVVVTGDIQLPNADCAEEFDIAAGVSAIDPGTVMVIDDDGALRRSERPYDRRVAGVVSGAGSYRPGIVLDKQETTQNRQPIALLGKVYCKVDAEFGLIEVGDLLTTSPTPGHAMRADDPLRAFGAVLGKALRPWRDGRGLVPILIALQ